MAINERNTDTKSNIAIIAAIIALLRQPGRSQNTTIINQSTAIQSIPDVVRLYRTVDPLVVGADQQLTPTGEFDGSLIPAWQIAEVTKFENAYFTSSGIPLPASSELNVFVYYSVDSGNAFTPVNIGSVTSGELAKTFDVTMLLPEFNRGDLIYGLLQRTGGIIAYSAPIMLTLK